MSKHKNREVKQLAARLEKQGYKVRITTNQHVRIMHPNGVDTAQWSSTGEDGRSARNARAGLRKIGAHRALSD
jgi:hypothetical protein